MLCGCCGGGRGAYWNGGCGSCGYEDGGYRGGKLVAEVVIQEEEVMVDTVEV